MNKYIVVVIVLFVGLSITGITLAISPSINANDTGNSISLGTSDSLSIDISLDARDSLDEDADWWLVASTPFGWYHFDLATSWTLAGSSYNDLSPTYQGALFDFSQYSVFNINASDIPTGTYTFYFAIDTDMNGIMDLTQLYYDSVSVTMKYNLPDTGQTASYTDTFGEDSDYNINSPSYTDNGNGTVTDNNTNLIWQQEGDDNTYTWEEAESYCNSLSHADYSDWRLPEIKEYIDIVDYGLSSPAIDETFFPNTNDYYWSSDYSTISAWYVDFTDGRFNTIDKSNNYYVRCVRGGEYPGNSFTDNGDGTVTDNITDIMWQQEDDFDLSLIQDYYGLRDWESAITYCEGLSLASYKDWRLPNIKELKSIVDYSSSSAVYGTYFPDPKDYSCEETPCVTVQLTSSYWSSTTSENNTDSAWIVTFGTGNNDASDKSLFHNFVKCVRKGEGD